MSIVTLKKKTQVQYNNMSVGSKTGFSLNGTHRNQGYVGQTSLSRSLPRTLMRGGAPRGHGGCCGQFPIRNIVPSAVTSTEDPTVIKSSTLTTSGMLDTKYRWVNRPFPYATVKPDNNLHMTTASDHIRLLKKKTLTNVAAIDANATPYSERCHGVVRKCMNYNSFYRKAVCNFTKPESDYVPISSGQYIENLNKKCSEMDDEIIKANVKPTGGAAFACGL